MSPIPLGSAQLSALVPGVGSTISTNEFGVDEGTIRYSLGNQSQAQGLRPVRGSAYAGALPQFQGMFCDRSGILGEAGQACFVDVIYKSINPGWGVPPPELTHDLEFRQITYGVDLAVGVPVPHPVIRYKFAATKPPGLLGTRSQSPPNAPTIGRYTYAEEAFFGGSVTQTANSVMLDLGLQTAITLFFDPTPAGWLCLREDVLELCSGKFYQVTQEWKRTLILTGAQTSTGA